MNYNFKQITIGHVIKVSSWKYLGSDKKIYMKPYLDNYKSNKPLKGPENCDGFIAFRGEDLFGLFEYYHPEEELEIGIAINPKHVGKGYAKDFIEDGLAFGKEYYNYQKKSVRLFVDKDNIPAYKAYLKAGFKVEKEDEKEYLMRYYF